jgi:beta-fructofuranosidase
VRWRRDGFFWAPGSTFDLECADIFSIGDWWYLLFSTAQHTRYRMSRSPYGPWSIPDDDLFDGRWLYAAKTAEVDAERVLFGWLADARPRNDDGERVWGGSLMTRRLVQRRDGSLAVDGSRRSAPPTGLPLGGGRVLDAADGFAALPVASGHDLELEIPVAVPASGRFGLFVRTDELLTEGYRIGFDVGAQTMSWSTVTPAGETLRLSRHCVLHPGAEIVVRATLSGSVVDVVAAGSALCARAFDAPGDRVSIWAEGARISFAEPVLGPQHRGIDK